MVDFLEQEIGGVYLIKNFFSSDIRGAFVKTIHTEKLKEIGFNACFVESYYSQSYKGVIRGMHFQAPPFHHEKLVYVTEGKILDVILDLRKTSKTFGKYISIGLSQFSNSVFIPKGCAHGFLTLSNTATVVYNVSTVYNNTADSGILWNSFGFDWKNGQPIISERDQSFSRFNEFNSPF
jgi:dTDP-4-dehydrorhamnose 3,5-epimerase